MYSKKILPLIMMCYFYITNRLCLLIFYIYVSLGDVSHFIIIFYIFIWFLYQGNEISYIFRIFVSMLLRDNLCSLILFHFGKCSFFHCVVLDFFFQWQWNWACRFLIRNVWTTNLISLIVLDLFKWPCMSYDNFF